MSGEQKNSAEKEDPLVVESIEDVDQFEMQERPPGEREVPNYQPAGDAKAKVYDYEMPFSYKSPFCDITITPFQICDATYCL